MRQTPELSALLPELSELAVCRSVPVSWRTRLAASIALLRSAPSPRSMRSTAALLRELADSLDGGEDSL
jgi:hypothetical protein